MLSVVMLNVSNNPLMLSVLMLSVVMLNVVMLNVVMLSVLMLNVIMLNVVAQSIVLVHTFVNMINAKKISQNFVIYIFGRRTRAGPML